MQEQELFQQYELKGWQFSAHLYKIIGASVLANLVLFAFMAQANFLTGKTCDSPIASGVCSVLDTLYVGSMIAATDAGFVDKPYNPTEILDSDEITMVEYSEPLKYPEGYFALANPEQTQPITTDAMGNQINSTVTGIPGITNVNPTSVNPSPMDLTQTKQNLPKQRKTPAFSGNLPTTQDFSAVNNPTSKNIKNNRTIIAPLSDDSSKDLKDTTAENKDKTNQDKSEPVKLGEINRKPFEDMGDEINEKRAQNKIDLTKNFSVTLDGTIKADGTFDADKTRFIYSKGDEEMVNAAKKALKAVGSSGFLGLLKSNGIDRVNITLVQDDTQIYAIVISDQKTPEKAATTASGINALLSAAIFADESNLKKLDDNSRVLVKNSKITSDKNNFVLKFLLPKQDAQAIIKKTLDDRAEKKKLSNNAEANTTTNAK
jgi:hypothetical protein